MSIRSHVHAYYKLDFFQLGGMQMLFFFGLKLQMVPTFKKRFFYKIELYYNLI